MPAAVKAGNLSSHSTWNLISQKAKDYINLFITCMFKHCIYFNIFLQYLLSHLTGRFRRYAVTQTDKRIKLVTEILTNIRIIKMYAWEKWFSSQVAGLFFLFT